MQKTLSSILIIFSLLLHNTVKSQIGISIPAFTAYAVPVEKSNEDDESDMFSVKDGLHNWTDTKQQIQFYFKIRNRGDLQLSLLIKNDNAGNRLSATIAGKDFTLKVPQSKEFKLVKLGSVVISDTGFYVLTLSSSAKKSNTIADIKSLELSGNAAKDMHFNAKPQAI